MSFSLHHPGLTKVEKASAVAVIPLPHFSSPVAVVLTAHFDRANPITLCSMLRFIRRMSTAAVGVPTEALALSYSQPGEPAQVLQLVSQKLPELQTGQVLIKMLKAPINPSDINTVQGKYPIMPPLPGIPGHEGVGQILAVGSEVSHLKQGQLVVPLEPGQGTWRTAGVFSAELWHGLPDGTPVDQAASLCVNPPSALAMLEEFVDLKPGDVVLQNGGTSAVAKLVSQIARSKGLKTVSVVRPRPDMEATVKELTELGADLVTTDDNLKDDLKAANLGSEPRLALNCVGGASALALCKNLAEGGTLVTYGGMSMQPVSVPTTLLIFKDITLRGFWLSGRFAKQQGPVKRAQVLDRLARLTADGQLHTPVESISIKRYQEAFEAATQGYKRNKVLLDMTD